MSWNGSGTYSRPTTTVSPAVSNTTIDADDMNTYTADVAAGVNACLAKNGENAATGDLDLGSNQINSLADGTLAADAATLGQIQDNAEKYIATAGSSSAYTGTMSPTLTAYAAGQAFLIKANHANDGDVTINIDTVGVKSIVDQAGNELPANTLLADGYYWIAYDGTDFVLLNKPKAIHTTAGQMDIDGTPFAVDGATQAAWETVGPAAASKQNTWTALGSLPSGIAWIEVSVYCAGTATAKTSLIINGYARGTGSAAAESTRTMMGAAVLNDGTSSNKSVETMNRGVKIPVDSDISFEVYWDETNATTQSVDLYLTGYGWN